MSHPRIPPRLATGATRERSNAPDARPERRLRYPVERALATRHPGRSRPQRRVRNGLLRATPARSQRENPIGRENQARSRSNTTTSTIPFEYISRSRSQRIRLRIRLVVKSPRLTLESIHSSHVRRQPGDGISAVAGTCSSASERQLKRSPGSGENWRKTST